MLLVLLAFGALAALALVFMRQSDEKPEQKPTTAAQPIPGQSTGRGPTAAAVETRKDGQKQDPGGTIESQDEKPKWDRPRFEERGEDRHRMVRRQIADRGVTDEDVLDAMRHVPRHEFVPDRYAGSAYADRPLPIGQGQTISQPYIVAFMTEQLQLKAGDRALEIGTGSAYQAAVLSEITPHVYTIEIIEELAKQASKRLDELGYKTVKPKTGDGYFGWKDHAPFDAIIVTAAAGHIPPPLLKQLKKGGRMIIPVGGTYEVQYLILVQKDERGELSSEQLMPVRFVPMTGRAQEGK
jgi:protein-L-isoaspartate(D-aspartate) O-methyltransferase